LKEFENFKFELSRKVKNTTLMFGNYVHACNFSHCNRLNDQGVFTLFPVCHGLKKNWLRMEAVCSFDFRLVLC
jgi:hypothetical protein